MMPRYVVIEKAVYANLFEVEASSKAEAISIVKRGEASPEHQEYCYTLKSKYEARLAEEGDPSRPRS